MRITILRGVAGSVAHGLSTPESDVDEHGVFSYHTADFWRLEKPVESVVTNDPDVTMHELEKFLRLASKANPSVLDTLWLDSYLEQEPEWGDRLLAIRRSFLSAHAVRSAYLGYASAQFKKLESRDLKDFSSSTKNRTHKHAKHLIRLLEQGHRLFTTGEMSVRVEDPERYFKIMNEWSIPYVLGYATTLMEVFKESESVLPDVPDMSTINDYLRAYRAAHV